MSSDPAQPQPLEDNLRPHSHDGIQEFDKRLPNWWLLTLYGAIAFAVAYWFVHYESNLVLSDGERITREMQRIEAEKLTKLVAMLNDDNLWQMSQNPEFVSKGAETYKSTCASCHGNDLRGRDGDAKLVGVNLADTGWIHGGNPTQVFATVKAGVSGPGMPAWGPVLGDTRIAQVVAYVMNQHKRGEEIVAVASPYAK
ncbi:MAG TPA: cbb3-type cytochrome c oxidase N-terminal domain-containing protein [Opitutaceae bacterium]|nr:cbb3-type cytochrome c oxidase N-terminal domain-containing protein [Opitutaceae bacterium]